MPLNTTGSPHCEAVSYLPVDSQLRLGPVSPMSVHVGKLTSLMLYRFYTDSHSDCKFEFRGLVSRSQFHSSAPLPLALPIFRLFFSVPWTFREVVMIVYQGWAPTDAHSLCFDQCSVIELTSTLRQAERFPDEDLGDARTAVWRKCLEGCLLLCPFSKAVLASP